MRPQINIETIMFLNLFYVLLLWQFILDILECVGKVIYLKKTHQQTEHYESVIP